MKKKPANVTLSPFLVDKKEVVEEKDRLGYFWGKESQNITASNHNGNSNLYKVPPVFYSCNKCGESGHWIEDCAMNKRRKTEKGVKSN